MRRVVLESPYAGNIERNVDYARACVRDSVMRGEAPIASHLLFTQPHILDDGVPDELALGIAAGHAWIPIADAVVVYQDFGISTGMAAAIAHAAEWNVPVEFRCIDASAESERAAI